MDEREHCSWLGSVMDISNITQEAVLLKEQIKKINRAKKMRLPFPTYTTDGHGYLLCVLVETECISEFYRQESLLVGVSIPKAVVDFWEIPPFGGS